MVHAGADITALLKLDASGFTSGLDSTSSAVTKFKESMMDLGKNSKTVEMGFNSLMKSLDPLLNKMAKFSAISKEVNTFKTFALALENIATAAQRMTTVMSRGQSGIVGLESVISAFQTGASSAEVTLRATNAQLQALANHTNSAKGSVTSLSESERVLQSQFQLLDNTLSQNNLRTSEVRAMTQMLRNEYGLTGQKLAEVRGQLMQTVSATQQYSQALSIAQNPLRQFSTTLNATRMSLVNLDTVFSTTNGFIRNATGEYARLKMEVDQVSNSYRMLRINSEGENVTLERSSQALAKNSAEMMKNAEAKLRAMGYTGQLSNSEQRLANAEQQVANSSSRASSSIQRQAVANRTATASTNQLASATNKLRGAFNSLKMIGTMVGSMLAYNFAHKLLVATGETIHAKSEMEGYFKMLNFGQNDINHFNQALDRTVAQFQRVNKYSLGETISSIGVEFNLTTKEMEKAMTVTSMITSEYLRAGRNANEASLAVKDVLQGQFQRLSRETGVKGEQLKEAGWSGDTTDVLGLMEALEKVGKSRNWDVFAEKANSLNDIITILQNRFGEWSADMVYKVQPAILSVFNSLMNVGSIFGEVFTGIMDWLTGDAIGKGVGWTLLATHIASVTLGLIHLRTGATLTQISQMGLTRSIGATILGLEAETVAEYGLRTSIVSTITGIDAEIVKREGRLTSIIATISGLKAEEVADIGRAKTLMASILGLDMATLKEYGFATALGTATTQMEAQTFASKGLLTQIALIGATTLPAIAVVGAFAVALGSLAMKTMEATDKMKNFYDIQRNGKQYVTDAKDSVKMLEDKQKELTETQKKYTEGSAEYENVGKAIDNINGKIELANQNVKDNYKAWQMVNSAQEHYDSAKQEAQLDLQQRINKALVDTGLSTEEANELSNNYLREAIDGSNQLYRALQSVVNQYNKTAGGVKRLTDYWSDKGLSDEEIAVKVKPYIDAQSDLAGHIEQMKLSTDIIELVSRWAMVQYDQIKVTFAENMPKIEAGDVEGGLKGMLLGLAHGLADLPIFGDFWDYVFEHSGIKEKFGGKGLEGLFNTNNDLFTQYANNFVNGVTQAFESAKQTLTAWWNNFWSFDWLLGGVSASDGSSDHPSFMEDISSILGFDIQTWVDSFMADPMGTLGIDLSGLDIFGSLLNFLFNTGDNTDFSWAMEYITNNIITPLSETWNMFMADPLSYLGGVMAGLGGVGSLLTLLLPSDGGLGIWEWANTNLIQPLGNALYQGITSIPLVSDILALFGLVNGENSGSGQKGRDLGESFKTAIEDKIRNIPILGDVLQILGLIPQANPTASSNGQSVGSSIKTGFGNGLNGMADIIRNEIGHIIDAIGQRIEEARNKANELGNAIVSGVRNAIDPGSPGIIARAIIGNEFGTYIPQVITDNGDLAYSSAQYYGEQIKSGISSVNTDSLSMDTAVANYETDAQNIAMSSQMMGTTTSTAFNDMSLAVNNTTAMMSSNVGTTYSQMQQKQTSSLQSMKTQNQTAYQEMYLKSHQSLVQMRDSTSNITSQMISAWTHMKVQLVATANQLRSESTSHFNTLSNTIGDFYRKIQNPSNWGAGTGGSTPVRSRRNTTAGRSFARGMRTRTSLHGAGSSSTYTGSTYMTIGSLKRKLCPDGSCDYLFDGFSSSDRVNVEEFLASITGEHGFGGWSGWDKTHFNYIKNTSDQWSMKSPVIQVMGGIPTNANFKVGDFENGTPTISFDSFKSMAESIFSPNGGIPYKHYMDSSWKGSWLGAIQSGACNCSDGAEAIIAFASACGFGGGQKVHGYWGNEGHFWAVINGEVFDTTAMQKGYGWRSPSVHGYGTKVRTTVSSGDAPSNGNKTINLTVNINEPVYGVDDLKEQIVEASREAMREEFNDPYTVTL